MKKLLLAAMLGTALASSAQYSDFTYAEDGYSFYGIGSAAQTYDVAIFLPGNQFKDANIKNIKVPVMTPAGTRYFTDTKLWLSSTLKRDTKGENVADIASYDVAFSDEGDVSMLEIALPEEYTIPAKGVYVGYSFTTTVYNTATQYPIALGPGENANSLWVCTSKVDGLTNWTNVNLTDGLSSALTVTLSTNILKDYNVSVVSSPDFLIEIQGQPTSLPVTFNTAAKNPVASVDFEYTIAGNTTTYKYVLPTPIPLSFGTKFNANIEFPAFNELISEDIEIKVVKVNDQPNESSQNSLPLYFGVVDNAPERRSLLEESTCTKCGYCTRGFAALEYLKKNNPEVICASYHNDWQGADPMTVGNIPFSASGNPSAGLNRSLINIDPYFGTQTYNSYKVPVVGDILAQNAIVTPWDISVSHVWDDDDHLTANVTLKNAVGYQSKNYKIGYILLSDGLTGTAASWYQTNYYNTENPVYIPELNAFCKGGEYGVRNVRGLVYDDVVISVDGYKGVANSVPTSLERYGEATHSKTWDLSKIKAALLPDKNKLRIVAVVLDNKGNVLNVAKDDVIDFGVSGGSAVDTVEDVNAPVEYYNLSGVKVDNPSNGIFIRRQGAHTSKVVIK